MSSEKERKSGSKDCLAFWVYRETANEPLSDPTSEQNHMGPLGYFLTSLDSSKSLWRTEIIGWPLGVETPLEVLHLTRHSIQGQVL